MVCGYAPTNILSQGIKRLEVDLIYDKENYQPKIQSVLGMPMFLR